MKLLMFNIAAIALLGAAIGEGYLDAAVIGTTGIGTAIIGAVFLCGQWRTWQAARSGGGVVKVRHVADTLVMLGLIGTVLGFIVALSGVDPASAGDVSRVTDMVAKLVEGMGVALWTTLEGSVLSLWLTINRRIISYG